MRFIFFLGALVFPVVLNAQDSSIADTVIAVEDFEMETEEEIVNAVPDSSSVTVRSFDESLLRTLRDDPDMNYQEPPTIGESFLDRFFRWLNELIETMLTQATETDWGRVIMFVLGIAVLVVIIMLILKVDAFKVFYAGQGASAVKYGGIEENIHEIDFQREIDEALARGDYRRGVRLLFLYSLKMLADRQYISWEQGKTNHEYVAELRQEGLRDGFDQLSYYFDYAWYGNFQVSRELYDRVNGIFGNWKTKLG